MQPVIIEGIISVPANTIYPNVITLDNSLKQYERSPFNAAGKFSAVQSAAGLRVTVSHGSQNSIDDSDMRVGTDIQNPNDTLNNQFFPRMGEQLVIMVSNPTGGTLSMHYQLHLEPQPDGAQTPPEARVTVRGPVAVANNTFDLDLFAGLRYNRIMIPSMLEVFMTASAAGMTRRLNVGMQAIAPPSAIAALNRIPTDPFDKTIEDVEVPPDTLQQLLVSNVSGGSLNVFMRQKLTELIRT